MSFFFTNSKKNWNYFCFDFKKGSYISQTLLKSWLIGNRTSCPPIQSVIILMIKQIGLPLLVWLQTELDSTQSCYHYLSLLLLLNTLLKIYTQGQKGKKAITKAAKEIVKKNNTKMTRLSLQNKLSLSLSISKNDIGNNLFSSGGEV